MIQAIDRSRIEKTIRESEERISENVSAGNGGRGGGRGKKSPQREESAWGKDWSM